MASLAADSTAARSKEGPISPAASRAMDGLTAGEATLLRPRKRPSTHMLLEDDEGPSFGNPGPDSVAIATSPSGTMRAGSARKEGGSRNEEERIKEHSLHRAHSCLALVGDRRCSCSGKSRDEQEHEHQHQQLEDDHDGDEKRCCGHDHAMENHSINAAASRAAEPQRRIKRIKSEPSIVVLDEAITSRASKNEDEDDESEKDDDNNTSSSHRDTDNEGGDSSRSSSSNDLEAMKQLDLSTHHKNADDSAGIDGGHDQSRQDTKSPPDGAAIVSVDGSNESSSNNSNNNADHLQQAKKAPSHVTSDVMQTDGGLETNPHVLAGAEVDNDGVPITPVYGVPPRPESCPADMDPDTFIRATVHAYLGYEPQIRDGLSLPSPDFFPPITEDDLAAYDTDVVAAVRENHLDEIRSFHNSGRILSCCNRFGESLIHMACRRGYANTVTFLLEEAHVSVTFLLEEAHVSVRIRDDCGRTPLHDACWHRTTQYEIVDTIIRVDPALLCISDKRGHTPFAYARREHWPVWRQFLFDRTDWIVAGFAQKEIMTLFGGVNNSNESKSPPKAQ